MDFEIYNKGKGDSFDVVSDVGSIDVKASSDRAKCILVEVEKAKSWKRNIGYPDYLSLVSVTETENGFLSKYVTGADFETFKSKSTVMRRGELIPNTSTPLKADNYVLTKEKCSCEIENILKGQND
jgi:hypothetical protein